MKYCVIMENTLSKLEETVEKQIKNGWEPLGSIAISHYKGEFTNNYEYHQAMINIEVKP